jgi:hypothetical protein
VHLALSGRPDVASYVRNWAGTSSVVHKTAMAVSFVAGFIRLSVYLSSTAMGCGRPRGVEALRRASDSRRGAFYAGFCIWTSENFYSTQSGE